MGEPIAIGMSDGKRKRGSPHMRWMHEIRDTTKLTMDGLREATRHRVGWRQMVADVTRSPTTGHHIIKLK